MRRRAPLLKLPADRCACQIEVASRLSSLEAKLLADDFGNTGAPDHFEQTQAHWCMRLLSAWQRHSATPHPVAVASSEGVADTPEKEADLLRQHWEGVFQHDEEVNKELWQPLLRRTPKLPLASRLPDVRQVEAYLQKVPDRAPGPDEISFGHTRPVLGLIAELVVDLIGELSLGKSSLESIFDTTFVFLPKSEHAALAPESWRPISLGNCLIKVALAVIFEPL